MDADLPTGWQAYRSCLVRNRETGLASKASVASPFQWSWQQIGEMLSLLWTGVRTDETITTQVPSKW
jgi:hypothetical protein